MTTALADPAKMIAKGAPHVIHNHEELDAYTSALFRLTVLDNPSLWNKRPLNFLLF
jgi:HTH-type transcriptional regulator/antitoxin HigA